MKRLDEKEFLQKALLIQPKNIDLSKVVFINTRTKVILGCKDCKKEWEILAKVVNTKPLKCPYCENRDKINSAYSEYPMTLYFIQIKHNEKLFYKVGITKTNVQQRFTISDLRKISILKEIRFPTGKQAYEMEQLIKAKFKDYRYFGKEKVLESNGNTELYITNIYDKIKELI